MDQKEEATVTLKKSELKAMIDEAVQAGLAGAAGGAVSRSVRKITDRTVTVRMIENRAVIGYVNKSGNDRRPVFIYERPDPTDPKQTISMVDIVLENMADDESPITIPFKQFREESARATCKVVKTEERPWSVSQGAVSVKEVKDYSAVDTGVEVDAEVVGVTRIYTVEVPSEFGGPRTVTVHESMVNIA